MAGYQRMDRKCCMDACTTSPAESMNNTIKHHSSKTNSRMNLDTSMRKIITGITNRLKRRHNQADREMSKKNNASRAPTKDYIIAKGQRLADRNFDASIDSKSAQLGVASWIVWDFDLVKVEDLNEKECLKDLKLAIPRFLRVRELGVTEQIDGNIFIPCACHERTKIGVPCKCFWRIARNANISQEEIMDVGMFDIRWLKIFNAKYGHDDDDYELAEILYDAQSECFASEGKGTQISEKYLDQLLGDPESEYPILGPGTSQEDLDEALWVMQRTNQSKGKATTWIDLQLHREGVDPKSIGYDDVDFDDIPSSQLSHGMHQIASITAAAQSLHEGLNASQKRASDGKLKCDTRSYDLRETSRKVFADDWKSFIEDAKVTDQDIDDLTEKMTLVFAEVRGKVNARYGKAGGGSGKMELYGQEGGGNSPVKKTKYGACR